MKGNTELFNSTAEIRLKKVFGFPRLATPVIRVKGPTKVKYSDSSSPSAGAFLSTTELVEMNMKGRVLGAGIKISLSKEPSRRSLGAIQGKADPNSASSRSPEPLGRLDSHFDVYIDIETPLGTFQNSSPVRMEAKIGKMPPAWTPYKSKSPPTTIEDKARALAWAELVEATHVIWPNLLPGPRPHEG